MIEKIEAWTSSNNSCQSVSSFLWCGMHPRIYRVYPKLIPKRGVVQFCHRAVIEKIDVWISSNNSCPSVSRRGTIFHYSEWCPPSTKQYHARHHMIFHFPKKVHITRGKTQQTSTCWPFKNFCCTFLPRQRKGKDRQRRQIGFIKKISEHSKNVISLF